MKLIVTIWQTNMWPVVKYCTCLDAALGLCLLFQCTPLTSLSVFTYHFECYMTNKVYCSFWAFACLTKSLFLFFYRSLAILIYRICYGISLKALLQSPTQIGLEIAITLKLIDNSPICMTLPNTDVLSTVLQFHLLCLNWYWHSLMPVLAPSPM